MVSHFCPRCGSLLQGTTGSSLSPICPSCPEMATVSGVSGPTAAPSNPSGRTFGLDISITSSTMGQALTLPPLTPEFLERFELQRVLGRGGAGLVLLTRDRKLDQPVAVKFLTRTSDATALRRFLREGKVLKAIRHPNVLRLLELGECGGHPYLVSEYLEGGTLRSRLEVAPRVALPAAVAIILQCVTGLEACHKAGVIHRDLKPENILFSGTAQAKIADFGIAISEVSESGRARLTREGAVVGTPLYMAPEQLNGHDASVASDLYALALILFEMLAGRHPHNDTSQGSARRPGQQRAGLSGNDPNVQIPVPMARFLQRALGLEPKERPATAALFASELRSAAGQSRPFIGKSANAAAKRHSRKAYWIAVILCAAACLFSTFAVGLGLYRWIRPPSVSLKEPPHLATAVTAAFVQFRTAGSERMSLKVWGELENSSAARTIDPDPGVTAPGGSLDVAISGLQPGTRYYLQLVGNHGWTSQDMWTIETHRKAAELIGDYSVRYLDMDTAEVQVENHSHLTAGVRVSSPEGEEIIKWDSGGPGPRLSRLRVHLPRQGVHHAWVEFKELAAEHRDPLNTLPLKMIPGAATLRSEVGVLGARRERDIILPPLRQVLEYPYSVVPNLTKLKSPPGEKLVKALSENERKQVEAETHKTLSHWTQDNFKLDLDLLVSGVPLWLADTSQPVATRAEIYESVMHLAPLEGAADMVLGKPLLGLDQAVSGLVKIERGVVKPADGYRPIPLIQSPKVKALLKTLPLPITNRLESGDLKDDTIHSIAADNSELLAAAAEMEIPEKDEKEKQRGIWFKLGTVPKSVALSRGLKIFVRVSNLDRFSSLWVRFGNQHAVCFTTVLNQGQAYVSDVVEPTIASIEKHASNLEITLPADYLTEADRDLSVRFEHHAAMAPATAAGPIDYCWLLDLNLRNP
jgi:hypothetical protein